MIYVKIQYVFLQYAKLFLNSLIQVKYVIIYINLITGNQTLAHFLTVYGTVYFGLAVTCMHTCILSALSVI